MKQCPTCQEEFADKFGFCPVDGTPLNGHIPHAAENLWSAGEPVGDGVENPTAPTIASEFYSEETLHSEEGTAVAAGIGSDAAIGSQVKGGREEYHLTMLEDAGLSHRLSSELRAVAHQSQLTWPEFKRDPKAF
ncbi:MAG TPA: hypothetical protein VF666_04520, partial [Pyrinomonadaceae bacterium]